MTRSTVFFKAYGKRDRNGIRQVMTENVRWTFPGRHPLSGTRVGMDQVIAFFDAMGAIMGTSNVQAKKLVTGASDDYVAECQHISTNREDGNHLDVAWCVLWRFENGKIAEGKHLAGDQPAGDKFVTKLKSPSE